MNLYKARNGNRNEAGKALYVFIVAASDEQALAMAKEAFRHHRGLNTGNREFIRLHAIIEDVSGPAASAVWALPSDD